MIEPTALSLPALAHALRSGRIALPTYLEGLQALFARCEPETQAFINEPDRFGRLQREAAALLARYPHPDVRPLLFGVPIGVKDIYHVDGFVTRAGSSLPVELLQGPQGSVVTALRRAGALILGKTVTTEFAYFAPGPTRNPHNLEHTPGGSSSGSAAAVAAGLTPLALGTQTIGSINRPAAYCGVVGYKPTASRVRKDGIIPVSPTADHVGYFVPRVADADFVAPLLCADWEHFTPDRQPVLGVPLGPFLEQANAEGLAHFTAVRAALREVGYTVKEIPAMPDFAAIVQHHQDLVAAEAAAVHRKWYAEYASRYHPKTVELLERGARVSSDGLRAAVVSRLALRQHLTKVAQENKIDLWISPPATGPAPRGLESTGDPILNLPWTHAGLPTVTLPAGKNVAGLPMGMQVAAQYSQDERMLAWSGPLSEILQELELDF